MQSARPAEQLAKEEMIYINLLKQMSADLFMAAPKDYLMLNWGTLEIYLSIDNLLITHRLSRYQVVFEALKTVMATTLAIIKRYDNTIELPADYSQNLLLVDIETYSTYFKVTPTKFIPENDKVFADDQVNLFEYIVDQRKLLEAIRLALQTDNLAVLAKNANEFYAKINKKLAATKALINSYQLANLESALCLDPIGNDAVMHGMKDQKFKDFKNIILEEKNARSKKNQIIELLRILISIAQINIDGIFMIHAYDEKIAKLRQLRAAEATFEGEFSKVLDSILVFSGREKDCLDTSTIYNIFWDYFGHINDPSWLSEKVLVLNQIIANANSIIVLFDDQSLVEDEFRRQNNIFRIVIDGIRAHKDVKRRLDEASLFMLREEHIAITTASGRVQQIMPPTPQNVTPLESGLVNNLLAGAGSAQINALNAELELAAVKTDYAANLKHTKTVIDELRRLDENMQLQVTDLINCEVSPRKKLLKLKTEITKLSTQISALRIEDKEYSPQNAEAVVEERNLAEWLLSQMRINVAGIQEEIKHVKAMAVQLQKAELNKAKREQAAELKRQKEAEQAERRRLKEEEDERLEAEEAKREAEAAEREAKAAAEREEKRLAAIALAKQEKLERKRLAQIKVEQAKQQEAEAKQEQARQERIRLAALEQAKRQQEKQEQIRLAAQKQAKLDEQKRQRLAKEEHQRRKAAASEKMNRDKRLKPKTNMQFKPNDKPHSPGSQQPAKPADLPVRVAETKSVETTRIAFEQIQLNGAEQTNHPPALVTEFTPTPSPSPVATTELSRAQSAPQDSILNPWSMFTSPELSHSQSFFSFSLFGTNDPASISQAPNLATSPVYSLFGSGLPQPIASENDTITNRKERTRFPF